MHSQAVNYRIILYLVVLTLFLFFRLGTWSNDPLLEDHDSVSLMKQALTYRSLDPAKISQLDASKTPFYPAIVALLTPSPERVETAARVTTFLFSIILFFIFIHIGERYTAPVGVAAGLLFLSFSPELTRLSISVLTEPSYITTVYLGLALFLYQCNSPTITKSIILGIVFGCAFLNRLEGILFLVFVPIAYLTHYLISGKHQYNFNTCLKYITVFIVTFVLVIAPQIASVSSKMGQFSLNGRQVWSLLLSGDDSNRSYHEKISGLDYSPSEVNIQYLQKHPSEIQSGKSSISLKKYVKTILYNFDDLYRNRIGELLGPFCIFFAGIGFYSLLRRDKVFDALFFLGFIVVGVAAPLVHNVVIRHIAVIAPAIMLLAGIGIYEFYTMLKSNSHSLNKKWIISSMIAVTVFVTLFPQMLELRVLLTEKDTINHQYRPSDFQRVTAVLNDDIKKQNLNRSEVKLATREQYASFFTRTQRVRLPYTDYARLITYLSLNSVDYLYLDHGLPSIRYPFMKYFQEDVPSEFTLIYSGENWKGKKVQLFRVN